jgi:hypothetical protein
VESGESVLVAKRREELFAELAVELRREFSALIESMDAFCQRILVRRQ